MGKPPEEQKTREVQACNYLQCLPATSQGSILISSRLSSLADEIGGKGVEIEEMTFDEGLDLLSRASHHPFDEPGKLQCTHTSMRDFMLT